MAAAAPSATGDWRASLFQCERIAMAIAHQACAASPPLSLLDLERRMVSVGELVGTGHCFFIQLRMQRLDALFDALEADPVAEAAISEEFCCESKHSVMTAPPCASCLGSSRSADACHKTTHRSRVLVAFARMLH